MSWSSGTLQGQWLGRETQTNANARCPGGPCFHKEEVVGPVQSCQEAAQAEHRKSSAFA